MPLYTTNYIADLTSGQWIPITFNSYIVWILYTHNYYTHTNS